MEKQYRYPGTRPFEEADRHLFFGRDNDIVSLSEMVMLEKMVVLFGKSGLGKTSLLNAGVLPHLKEEKLFTCIKIRFGAYTKDYSNAPIELLGKRVAELDKPDTVIWQKIANIENTANAAERLWLMLKSIHCQQNAEGAIVLIFDQFEELFNYPTDDVKLFGSTIAALLNLTMPLSVKNTLREKLKANRDLLTTNENSLVFAPLNLKVIFSLRSDKISLLNRLKEYLPDIYRRTYELQPLTLEQARDAMLNPATKDGEFQSPKFSYTHEAQTKILDFLSKNNEQRIETFQLQLLCQFTENLVIIKEMTSFSGGLSNDKNPAANRNMPVETRHAVSLTITETTFTVTPADLGDLETIFTRHYDDLIAQIQDIEQRLAARRLIEEHLIQEGSRVPLPEVVITRRHNIGSALLSFLENNRLIRREPNTTGGFSFEISHDTLVEPILKSYQVRKAEDDRLEAERCKAEKVAAAFLIAAKEKAEREKKLKELRLIVMVVSFTLIISLGLTLFGFYQKKRADIQTQQAIEQKKQADESRERSETILKFLAEINRSDSAEITSYYKIFIEYGISKLGIGEWQTAKKSFEIAKICPDVPQMNNLPVLFNFVTDSAAAKEYVKSRAELTNEMVLVEGGVFMMGDSAGNADERPTRKVKVSSFYMSRFEITNSQYARFLNQYKNEVVKSGKFKGERMVQEFEWGVIKIEDTWMAQPGYENFPVVYVTWYGAMEFCQFYALSLPTESQWEFAAKGGAISTISDTIQSFQYSGSNIIGEVAWYCENSGDKPLNESAWNMAKSNANNNKTHKVGQKKPNQVGIYDMSGNVWEWCSDWYGVYPDAQQFNPTGPSTGLERVLRGGGWNFRKQRCRTVNRFFTQPTKCDATIGFRIVSD